MYDYWGKLLHMSEKFCNFASAMKGAPRREESGKRRVERGMWRAGGPKAKDRTPVRDEATLRQRWRRGKRNVESGEWKERLTNKPNNGL